MKKNLGITLIELLVVMVIISILALIAYAGLSGARDAAKQATVKASMDGLIPSAEVYYLYNTYSYDGFCNSAAITSAETACVRVYADCGCDGTPRGACTDDATTWAVTCTETGGFTWTCENTGTETRCR